MTLTLLRGDERIETRASGSVTRRAVVASFGDLGKVSVRFQGEPAGASPPDPREEGRACRGRSPITEYGVFNGSIEFRGENDFTRIAARHAPGTVEQHFRRVCKRTPVDDFKDAFDEIFGTLPFTLLEARARVDGANVIFNALSADFSSILGSGESPSYSFIAGTVERDVGLRVARSAIVEGGEGDFLGGKPGAMPQTVTVLPPKPFLASAEHSKEPGLPASWVGPLAVRLPGTGAVPLTGPGFRTAYCNLTLADILDGGHCLPRRGEPVLSSTAALARALLQGSGSQSQAFWDARLSWSR